MQRWMQWWAGAGHSRRDARRRLPRPSRHDGAVLWPLPELFRPERFKEEDLSVLCSDLRLAPFGQICGRGGACSPLMAMAKLLLARSVAEAGRARRIQRRWASDRPGTEQKSRRRWTERHRRPYSVCLTQRRNGETVRQDLGRLKMDMYTLAALGERKCTMCRL